jgi:hypothetical protein
MEEPAPKHEQSDLAACRRFWASYLKRQTDDFVYCQLRGVEIPTDGYHMPPAERARLWCEQLAWFFDADDGEIGSLSWTCATIGISASRMQARVWKELGDDIQLRRRRLDRQERAAMLVLLKKGKTTTRDLSALPGGSIRHSQAPFEIRGRRCAQISAAVHGWPAEGGVRIDRNYQFWSRRPAWRLSTIRNCRIRARREQ